MSKIRPLIKCHGGKYYLAPKIIPILPPHKIYVEPFAGGASVLLNKNPSILEILNDLDKDLYNLYRFLQMDNINFLISNIIDYLPYSEESFEDAVSVLQKSTNLRERAIAYLVRNRMSRGGMNKTFSFSQRQRGGKPGDVNAWETFVNDNLPKVIQRIKKVHLFNQDAIEIMQEYDSNITTHYLDPPYLPESRTAKSVYNCEMSYEEHVNFLDIAKSLQGGVVISGYHSPLYDDALKTWRLYEFRMANHSGQNKKKQKRIECLWVNR